MRRSPVCAAPGPWGRLLSSLPLLAHREEPVRVHPALPSRLEEDRCVGSLHDRRAVEAVTRPQRPIVVDRRGLQAACLPPAIALAAARRLDAAIDGLARRQLPRLARHPGAKADRVDRDTDLARESNAPETVCVLGEVGLQDGGEVVVALYALDRAGDRDHVELAPR